MNHAKNAADRWIPPINFAHTAEVQSKINPWAIFAQCVCTKILKLRRTAKNAAHRYRKPEYWKTEKPGRKLSAQPAIIRAK